MACIRIALIQMEIGKCKADNLARAVNLIKKAKSEKAEIIALPECFNSPYGTEFFGDYAENIPSGLSCKTLAKTSLANQVHLVAGSIPEKTHLFDINIPGGITFRESETLSAGDSLSSFQLGSWNVGLGICYDLRFNEMATLYRKMGCQLLLYPGAFNMKTGPLHWELLLRARAVDTQSYVAGIAPARDVGAGYVSFGNSMLVDPWGKILCRADAKEEILYATLGKHVNS
ncbi:hypothetical protein B566_EDAN009221 [Ephemera danica]|nr:hypothetical protein B566_EDAN009221 [Ephemera danica]